MSGRKGHSGSPPALDLSVWQRRQLDELRAERGYTVIARATQPESQLRPYLEATGQDYHIITYDLEDRYLGLAETARLTGEAPLQVADKIASGELRTRWVTEETEALPAHLVTNYIRANQGNVAKMTLHPAQRHVSKEQAAEQLARAIPNLDFSKAIEQVDGQLKTHKWQVEKRPIPVQKVSGAHLQTSRGNPFDYPRPDVLPADQFHMREPTLVTIRGGKVQEVFVQGMDYEAFSAATGMVIHTHGSRQKTFKRVGRALRGVQMSYTGRLSEDTPSIEYLDFETLPYGAKQGVEAESSAKAVRDGGAVVSRDLVRRMALARVVTPAMVRDGLENHGFTTPALIPEQWREKDLAALVSPTVTGQLGEVTPFAQDNAQQSRQLTEWIMQGAIDTRELHRLVRRQQAVVLSPFKKKLLYEMEKSYLVEFTIDSQLGQDKGHALVSDRATVDFQMARDHKREVSYAGPGRRVDLSFISGKKDATIDIISIVNRQQFLPADYLVGLTRDKIQGKLDSLESGDVAAMRQHFGGRGPLHVVESDPVSEMLASGINPLHYPTMGKRLYRQLADQLERDAQAVRTAFHGARVYIKSQSLADDAGWGIRVKPGEAHLSLKHKALIVADEDWLQLPDSMTEAGIGDVAGGADFDDAVTVFQFADKAQDGARRLHFFRQPNAFGEGITLDVADTSDVVEWQTAGGETISFPEADSRLLPTRADNRPVTNLELIANIEANQGEISAPMHSVTWAKAAAGPAVINQPVIGQRTNTELIFVSTTGEGPAVIGATEEQVIDVANKDGGDTTELQDFLAQSAHTLLHEADAVDPVALERYVSDGQEHPADFWRAKREIPLDSDGHLSQIRRGLMALDQQVKERGEAVLATATLPTQITDYLIQHRPEMIDAGAQLNKAYVGTLATLRKELGYANNLPLPADIFRQLHDKAYDRVQKEYERYRPVDRPWLSLGAMVSAQLNGEGASARAAWLTERRQDDVSVSVEDTTLSRQRVSSRKRPVPFQETMEGLRRLGLAADLIEKDGQAERHWRQVPANDSKARPAIAVSSQIESFAESSIQTEAQPSGAEERNKLMVATVPAPMLGLDEVPYWLDRASKERPGPIRENRTLSQRGQKRTTKMLRQIASRQSLSGRILYIKEEEDGLYAVNEVGQRLGALSLDSQTHFVNGQQLVLDKLFLHEGQQRTHVRFSLKQQ